MASTEQEVTVPFFKKKSRGGRPATARIKRSPSPPSTSTLAQTSLAGPSATKSEVIFPSKKTSSNLLSAGTKRTRTDSGLDDENDRGTGERGESSRDGPDVKWTAEGSHRNAALAIIEGDEAEALTAAKRAKTSSSAGAGQDAEEGGGVDDGLYHGQKAYLTHVTKTREVPKAMRVGPQRGGAGGAGGSTIRTVTIMDYQPDVCKDYKETGYCGYGDSCKFLHDRGTCELPSLFFSWCGMFLT